MLPFNKGNVFPKKMMYKKSFCLPIIFCFFLTSLGPLPAHADSISLPLPGTMVNLSPAYQPVIIKGLTVHKDDPFLFDFIVDVGQDKMSGEPLKKEGEKLIKYFLASLAIPDKDVWVNLSPYEKNKIIPDVLGQTDMGRDLLEQDYILKQITASLIYPEKKLGKTFWDKVYTKAQQMYGTTQVPVNTFNKVWIMADRAEVFEHNQTAFVVDSHLKVMLEEDYLATLKHNVGAGSKPAPTGINQLGSNIVRQIILPQLEKEVNTGKNFANLRQIFNSIILSSWYKRNLKQALLNQVYANQSKVKGIMRPQQDLSPDQIYEQYLKAYKKGVFNYIKEEVFPPLDGEGKGGVTVPRKYFSGGTAILNTVAANPIVEPLTPENEAQLVDTIREPLVDFATIAFTALNRPKPPMAAFRDLEGSWQKALYGGVFNSDDTAKSWAGERGIRLQIFEGTRNILDLYEKQWMSEDFKLNMIGIKAGDSIEYNAGRGAEYWKNLVILSKFKNPKAYILNYADGSKNITIVDFAMRVKAEHIQTISIKSSWEVVVPRKVLLKVGPDLWAIEMMAQTEDAVRWARKPKMLLNYNISRELTSNHHVTIEGSKFVVAVTNSERSPFKINQKESIIDCGGGQEKASEIISQWFQGLKNWSDAAMQMVAEKKPLQVLDERGIWDAKLNKDDIKIIEAGIAADTSHKYLNFAKPSVMKYVAAAFPKLHLRDEGKDITELRPELSPNTRFIYQINRDNRTVSALTWGELENFLPFFMHRFEISGRTYSVLLRDRQDPIVVREDNIPPTRRAKTILTQPRKDYAALALQAPGGIDLNTSNGMRWKVSKDGNGVEINVDPAMIARFRAEGIGSLSPVVVRITPIASIWSLDGLKN